MIKQFFAAVALVSCAVFALENLYEPFDAGVEQGEKSWTVMSNSGTFASISDNGGVGGSGALVFDSPDTNLSGGFAANRCVSLQGGCIYTVECMFTGEVKSGNAVLVAQAWNLGIPTGKPLVVFESRPIDESVVGRWSKVHCTFELPEDANAVKLKVLANNFSGKLAFDNFALYESDSGIGLPWFEKEPPMNGTLDADFAANAVHINDFQEFRGSAKHLHKDQTDVYVGMTNETIFGAFLMHHDPKAPLDSPKIERDGVLFKHDCVEMFLTFIARDTPYFHFAFNAGGAIYDSCDGNENWNCDVKSACGKLSDSCDLIQFSIPLKNVGYNHATDAGIVQIKTKMNFARTHIYAGGARDYSCWSKAMGSFHDQDALVMFTGFDKTQGRICSRRFWNVMAGDGGDMERITYWPETKPLYSELISDTPNPFKGHAAYIWPRPLEQINVAYGIQYGFAYSRAEILETYRKHGLHHFARTYAVKDMLQWSRDTGIGICLYFPYYINDHKMSYDKATYDKAFADTRKLLADNPGCFWGISLGDEDFEWFLDNFVKQANNKELVAKTPALQEAIRTVKEKFGHGKYGVPKDNVQNGERFEWLATKNYMLSRTLQMQKDLYALCQEFKSKDGKPLVCISGDPMGGLHGIQQQSREKDYCDIFTGQVVPMPDRYSQNICFTTKILKDFTGKAVWPCAHVEPYSISNPNKATAIYLSEVARGGGTGLQIWNYDNAANERLMGNTCFDYYGHRPRWDYIMEVVDRFSTMNLLKFPEDDLAIYLSNDTFLSYKDVHLDGAEALFTYVGPSSGAWFKFICGTQLRDGELNLSKWKTIMIPYADIEFAGNQKALMDYVKNGGTLVCFDPFAFSFNDDGTDTAANREALFGARTVKESVFKPFAFRSHPLSKGINPMTLFTTTSEAALVPLEGTKVLAEFNDGKVAATVKEYVGGGRAVLFAMPLAKKNLKYKAWVNMFTQLLGNLGVKTGHDIWRFTFPHEDEKEPLIKHKCLTGNYFYWYLNEAKPLNNVTLPKGFYSYSIAPDGSETSAFTFKAGRLTNRLEAPRKGDYFNWLNNKLVKSGKLTWRNFADKWTKTEPLDIIVDFGKEVTINNLKLFYNGDLPALTVVADGKEYSVKGENTPEVRCAAVELPSVKATNITLKIPARRNALVLSEMEVWGEP